MLQRVVICIFFLFLLAKPSLAIYDPLSVPNNKYGIHILETTELEKAAEIINNNGDWGYVTMPIRANERNLPKWTKFMQDCQKLHLIPILRIASFPVEDQWMAPNEWDLVDFANFLNDLPWPIQNRYIVIYNEPNHKNEWGGFVYPQEYARVLDRAIDIFHKINADFFVISAGFDSSAPKSADSMNEFVYIELMNQAVPNIFMKVDGFSSHSYGNPGFATAPNIYSPISVANYRFEQGVLSGLGVDKPKIFITEAGWASSSESFYKTALENIWLDENIIAITPFVLNAPAGPFSDFSFLDQNGNLKPQARVLKNMAKTTGQPKTVQNFWNTSANINPAWTGSPPPTSPFNLIASLKAVFSAILKLAK